MKRMVYRVYVVGKSHGSLINDLSKGTTHMYDFNTLEEAVHEIPRLYKQVGRIAIIRRHFGSTDGGYETSLTNREMEVGRRMLREIAKKQENTPSAGPLSWLYS